MTKKKQQQQATEPVQGRPLGPTDTLWNADPKCDHRVVFAEGGGMRCVKCPGWFCL